MNIDLKHPLMNQRTTSLYCDFHVHSNYSDGTLTPKELVEHAHELGITCFALTDHDSVEGVEEARIEGKRVGIDVVAGVEIGAKYKGGVYHILGIGIDPASTELQKGLRTYQEERENRNQKIFERLKELGIEVGLEEIGDGDRSLETIGRPHIARLLVDKKVVPNMEAAFTQYLGRFGRAFVKKDIFSSAEAFDLIHKAHGYAMIAHPVTLNLSGNQMKVFLEEQKELGLDGMEVYSTAHNPQHEKFYLKLTQELGLLRSAGSDFHGTNKKGVDLGYVRPGNRILQTWVSSELLGQTGVEKGT